MADSNQVKESCLLDVKTLFYFPRRLHFSQKGIKMEPAEHGNVFMFSFVPFLKKEILSSADQENVLHVEGVEEAVTVNTIRLVFSTFGPINSIAKTTGGFQVEYSDILTAIMAKDRLNGRKIPSHLLKYSKLVCCLSLSYSAVAIQHSVWSRLLSPDMGESLSPPEPFFLGQTYKSFCAIMDNMIISTDGNPYTEDELLHIMVSKHELRELSEITRMQIAHHNVDVMERVGRLGKHSAILWTRNFTTWYMFLYFLLKDDKSNTIASDKAIRAWLYLFCEESHRSFGLLPEWVRFLNNKGVRRISEDEWRQVLIFSMCFKQSIEDYDLERGSWCVLLDNFVYHLKGARSTTSETWNN